MSCRKEEDAKLGTGESDVLLNGQKYQGQTISSSNDQNNPTSFAFWVKKTKQLNEDVSFTSEALTITAEKILGKQIIRNCDAFREPNCNCTAGFTTAIDYDTSGDRFVINENAASENYIEITESANNFKEVWGVYQCEVIRVKKVNGSSFPDTIKFINGNFHLKFK
jgi:hypothetical protein